MAKDHFRTIWQRLVKHSWRRMSPEAARALLAMRFPQSDIARMNRLAARARAGRLTDAERTELDQYIRVGNILTVWQSHAAATVKSAKAG